MNNTISTTIGIDTLIQDIQTTLYDNLTVEWVDDVDAYGRVYKRMDADGNVIPAWFIGGTDYKDVYYNDAFSCCYMFVDDDEHTTEDEIVYNTDLKAIFMVDLSRILPSNDNRADMQAQNDVIEILRNNAFERFSVTGITKGIRNVFRGFNQEKIKFSDGHPYHCFSVNLRVNYYLTDKCD